MKGCLNGMLGPRKMTEMVAEAYAGIGVAPSKTGAARYVNGVQTFLLIARTAKESLGDRRRAARQLGLFRMERESRCVEVGKRKVKAWRVPGTPEYLEHARIVARLAEEFSGAAGSFDPGTGLEVE